MSLIFTKLKEIDLFSSSIGLHFNRSFFYKTPVSGFISALVIAFIISFFSSRISAFYGKEEVKAIVDRIYEPDPPKSIINADRFMFALRIYQTKRDFLTRPYFNITVTQGVYELKGGKQVRTFYNVELEPCTHAHWDGIKSGGNFSKLFEPFGDDFLCPVPDSELFMQGMFGSKTFGFLQVSVTACKSPNDPSKRWNPTCAPDDEVQKITQTDGFHGMNIYHSNYVLNPQQSEKYFLPYINDKLYFTFVPYQMTQLCDIYFADINVETDESLLPTSEKINLKFLTQENNDVRETTQLSRKDGVFLLLTLRLSPYVSKVSRSYKKVTQLMSELGGFVQIVCTCVGFIMCRYNHFKFTLDLANNLYQFDKTSKKQKGKKQKKGEKEEKEREKIKTYKSSYFQKNQLSRNTYKNTGLNKMYQQNSNLNIIQMQSEEVAKKQDTLNEGIWRHNNLSGIKGIEENNNQIYRAEDDEWDKHVSEQIRVENGVIGKFQRVIRRIKMRDNVFRNYQKQEQKIVKRQSNFTQMKNGDKKLYLLNEFNKIIKYEKNLKIGFRYFLSKITFNRWFNSEKNEYISRATELIHTDLDICNILDKIQQIDKIKNIVFNSNQSNLFNFYPKPKINLAQNQSSKQDDKLICIPNSFINRVQSSAPVKLEIDKGLLSQKIIFDTVESYKKLYNSYLLLSQQSAHENDDAMNKRLISCLGSEILDIFNLSKMIESDNKISLFLENKSDCNVATQFYQQNDSINSQNNVNKPFLLSEFHKCLKFLNKKNLRDSNFSRPFLGIDENKQKKNEQKQPYDGSQRLQRLLQRMQSNQDLKNTANEDDIPVENINNETRDLHNQSYIQNLCRI